MSDDKETVIRKGKRAAQLQADPLLIECLEAIKARHIQNFVASSPEKTAQRELAYWGHKAVEDLQLELTIAVNNGKFEEARVQK